MQIVQAAGAFLLAGAALLCADQPPRMPMPIEFERSAEFGWLNKKVLDARMLDDMADARTWTLRGQAKLLAAPQGGPSKAPALRVEMEMFRDKPAPTRNGLASMVLRREFGGQDWRAYNRISVWIRPELSGFPMLPLEINMRNDGEEKVPDVYRREGIHYVTLQDRKWQQVVWEIEPLARDKVTSIEIGYFVNKMLADEDDGVAFDIARLELQRVEPDHYEGWNVAPGRIAFSHTGYQTGFSKTALAAGLAAREFRLIRLDNNAQGEIVLTKPVRNVKTRLGEFEVLDFSEVRLPGRYVIQAGDARTRPFAIGDNVWRPTLWKAINFMFAERCGYPIPGSHDVCHRDWQATKGDQKIVINGGWHDAGDLSQGLVNTGEITYAMFALAERMRARGEDPVMLGSLLDEAKWGLDWTLKTRFEGGYRIGFAGMNIWTNGILGDADDRTREALNNPNVNYIAAAAEAIAWRVLRESDPELAARALRTAEDDWRHAIVGVDGPETWHTPAFAATPMELAGIGILASLELYEATGKQQYADKAVELAEVVSESQQKSYVGGKFPLAGFFYTGPDRKRLFHQFHRASDQAPIVAMARLCEAFPEHPDWMKWYAVAALYSEYQKTSARATEPYAVLPAYVYRDTEHLEIEENDRYQSSREAFRLQVLEGMPMGDGWYLKAFPVWFARRGNYGVLLSQAKGLSAAAHLRGDLAAADLAQKQLQWVVGRNPFSQSTMYGEGYDWAQQYSVSSGDIVGALPVGMQTRADRDAPYWPSQNCYVYKEVWVHPVGRWFWLMQDLAGPALVQGRVAPGAASKVEFVEAGGGEARTVAVDAAGAFRVFLPEGRYTARAGSERRSLTALPGGVYRVDLRPGRGVDFELAAGGAGAGEVAIRVTASGAGSHSFSVRAENLVLDRPHREVKLAAGKPATLVWKGRVAQPGRPWVVVAFADGDLSQRRELMSPAPEAGAR